MAPRSLSDEEWVRVAYLKRTIEEARLDALSDTELLDRLGAIEASDDAAAIRGAIERRANSSVDFDARVVDLLKLLDDGGGGIRTDWTIYRLIKHATFRDARLADVLVESPRSIRRRAAYRFYFLERVITDAGVRALPRHYLAGERDPLLVRIIATDPRILDSVDIELIMESCPNGYWRMRALVSVAHWDWKSFRETANDWPEEFVWACGQLEHRSDASLEALRVLRAHDEVPGVVARAVQSLGRLKEPAALREGIAVAEALWVSVMEGWD